MPAVLLRMTGLDAFDRDAQAQPPNREPGEIEQPIGGCERNAIVGTDGWGKPLSLKRHSKAVKAVFSAFDSMASHSSR
jgi:hypothetical protein